MMRWLHRRRRRETRGVRAGIGLPPGRAPWRRLPPLAPTVLQPPLTAAASMGVCAADRIRPLVHPPDRTGPMVRPAVEPVTGRVTGLIAVRAETPKEHKAGPRKTDSKRQQEAGPEAQPQPQPRAPRQAALPDRAPVTATPPTAPRLTPRVLASAGPRPILVEAVDAYVGDPMPDAAPPASSAWLRMVESYRPPWAAGAGATPPAPTDAWPPIPEGGTSWSSEVAAAPPRPPREGNGGAQQQAARRASLAESRRLGLGKPLRRPGSDDTSIPEDQHTGAVDAPGPADEPPVHPQAGAAPPAAPPPGSASPAESGQSSRPVPDNLPVPEALAEPVPEPVSEAVRETVTEPVPDPVRDVPRLGLGHPVAPPVRSSRNPRSGTGPTHRRTPTAPEEPAPRSSADDAGADVPAQPADPAVRPPAAPLPAGPVYRFVPGERSARATGPGRAPVVGAPPAAPPVTPRRIVPVVVPVQDTAPSTPRYQPLAHPPVQTAPSELADAVRRAHGVDVSDVPVHRGPEAAAQAQALGARAFTREGQVFLPADEGPLDHPVARGLLAHELTHAAQQRALGAALPSEDSDAGAALEAEAVATEQWARGLGMVPVAGGALAGGAEPPARWAAPWTVPGHATPAPTSGVQRQVGDVAAMVAPGHPPSVPPPAEPPASRESPLTGETGTRTPFERELVAVRDKVIELSGRRALDLDDPGDIEELAVRVYQKIHGRLRRELLVDRERAGRLGETGPFGWAR